MSDKVLQDRFRREFGWIWYGWGTKIDGKFILDVPYETAKSLSTHCAQWVDRKLVEQLKYPDTANPLSDESTSPDSVLILYCKKTLKEQIEVELRRLGVSFWWTWDARTSEQMMKNRGGTLSQKAVQTPKGQRELFESFANLWCYLLRAHGKYSARFHSPITKNRMETFTAVLFRQEGLFKKTSIGVLEYEFGVDEQGMRIKDDAVIRLHTADQLLRQELSSLIRSSRPEQDMLTRNILLQ